jgi:hypothetical protein
MSRARHESFVYVVADDVDQAKGDLAQDWSNDRRQRWALDTGTPTTSVADVEHTPGTPSRLQAVIREARLRAERDAVASAIPPDVTDQLRDNRRQHAILETRRHDLETGGRTYWQTPEGRAGAAVERLATRIDEERRYAEDPQASRSQRRTARYQIRDLTPQHDDAMEHWKAVAGSEHARLTTQIDQLTETIVDLGRDRDHRVDWFARHPEALPRLQRLERELDAYRPQPPIQRTATRTLGYEPPSRPTGPELDGPDLGIGL